MEKKTWIIVNSESAKWELIFKCEAVDMDDAFRQWEQSAEYKEPNFLIDVFCLGDVMKILSYFGHMAI